MWTPGDVINGSYRLGLLARRFGNVAVHFAEPVGKGPPLLIHVLCSTVDEGSEAYDRFEALGRALCRYTHDAMLDVFDADCAHGRPFFVTEAFEGIKGKAESGQLQPLERLHLLTLVVSGVEALHQKGWAHGTLSLSSLAWAGIGPRAKIIDLPAVLLEQSFCRPSRTGAVDADRAALVSLSTVLGFAVPKAAAPKAPAAAPAPSRPAAIQAAPAVVMRGRVPRGPVAQIEKSPSTDLSTALGLDDYQPRARDFDDGDELELASMLRPNLSQRLNALFPIGDRPALGTRRPRREPDSTATINLAITCAVAFVTLLAVLKG